MSRTCDEDLEFYEELILSFCLIVCPKKLILYLPHKFLKRPEIPLYFSDISEFLERSVAQLIYGSRNVQTSNADDVCGGGSENRGPREKGAYNIQHRAFLAICWSSPVLILLNSVKLWKTNA